MFVIALKDREPWWSNPGWWHVLAVVVFAALS